MAKKDPKSVVIVGAGLAGCFMAILLAKRGYTVSIFERATRKEITNNASKRSFNLTFYGYAVNVLKETNLWSEIEPHVLKLSGSITQVTRNSKPIFAQLNQKKMPYYTVQRSRMLDILLRYAAKQPTISVNFGTNVLSIDKYNKSVTIQNVITQKIRRIPCSVVLGADGANSIIRAFMQQAQNSTHSHEYADWNYKQIIFPKDLTKKLGLLPNVAYTWTRKNAVMVTFPNNDGSRTAQLILPINNKTGFAALTTKSAIKKYISEQFPLLLPALSQITDAILKNPEGNLVTIHTSPWYYKDFIAILGDSAHAFYPFFGQGVSAAFGDCMELIRLVDRYPNTWTQKFAIYEKNRKIHMDTLGELSKAGLTVYRRDKRAMYTMIQDHIDTILHRLLPQFFNPPIFTSIAHNPGKTADHYTMHRQQQRRKKLLGISLVAGLATNVIRVHDIYREITSRSYYEK